MGKVSLVSGAIHGKVGVMYGATDKGHKVLKAVPFSHTPHNQKQKNSYSSFGCLQRVSSLIAKTFFKYLHLSSKKQSKINAVAHWLKPLVSNGVFAFYKFKEIIPVTNELLIDNVQYNATEQLFSLDFATNFSESKGKNPTVFFGFYNEQGQGLAAAVSDAQSGHIEMPTDYTEINELNLVAFISFKKNNHWYQTGLVLQVKGGGYVIKEVWYPNRMNNGQWHFAGNETVVGEDVNYTFADETLYFTAN